MPDSDFLRDHIIVIPVTMPAPRRETCRHCGRSIVKKHGVWIDPAARGDDGVWRETCDAHDTFTAEHEPDA